LSTANRAFGARTALPRVSNWRGSPRRTRGGRKTGEPRVPNASTPAPARTGRGRGTRIIHD
jgi:hypothetical protein